MPHIDDRQIDAYATGLLPEAVLAATEEHLLVCPECQLRLEQADEFIALFREAVQQPAPARARWRSLLTFGRPAAWAGAAAVAILAVAIPLQMRQGPAATIILRSLRGPEATIHATSRTPL